MSSRREDNNSEPEDSGPSWWSTGLGVAAGVATLASGIYMAGKVNVAQARHQATEAGDRDESSAHDAVSIDNITDAVSRLAVCRNPSVNNLNSLLDDIHMRYIAIKKEEFASRYNVFRIVFNRLNESMKAVDSYYERHCGRLLFRREEFNIYIIFGLPVNIYEDNHNRKESDIVIEPKHAGFVQLRVGVKYRKILARDGPDCHINKQAYLWLDEEMYILRSKFTSWFRSVVDRALKQFQNNDGAYTLWITNHAGFRLDVDLVPILRFPEERWLGSSKAYRDIPTGCSVDYWTVVPKANKFGANTFDENRSWHVVMYEQEKKFIHNSFHFRQCMRLLKKLRDTQQMNHIENYHIETIFLWKTLEFPKSFWQNDVATVFKVMLQEFYEALVETKISFFWKESHNMIEMVPKDTLKGYARKLMTLAMDLEDESHYMSAAEYLLTPSEYTEYKGLLNHKSIF